jgi:hypothetical protein
MIETKAFRTFIRIYALFKSERFNAKIKLIPHKALIISVMTYACPIWELAADTYLLNCSAYDKVLHTIGNLPRCTSVCECDYTNCADNKHKSCKIMRMNMLTV